MHYFLFVYANLNLKKTGCWYSTCSFASCSKNWQKLTLVHSKQTSSLSAEIAPLCSVDPQHTYWYNHAVIYDRNFVKFGLISIIYANIQNAPQNFAAHFPDIIHTKFHASKIRLNQTEQKQFTWKLTHDDRCMDEGWVADPVNPSAPLTFDHSSADPVNPSAPLTFDHSAADPVNPSAPLTFDHSSAKLL